MSEPTASNEVSKNQFGIDKIFIKDVSFEAPNSPMIFAASWDPEINLQLGTTARAVAEGLFEVVLQITVTAKIGDKTAYLAEIHQAGLFTVQNFKEADLGAMLGSFCPNLLFPFAREAVASTIGRGGFPPLYLKPINFDALYAQRVQQMQEQIAAQQPSAEGAVAAPTTH